MDDDIGRKTTTRDILVRPAGVRDADAIAVVHVAAWRETYAGLMPARFLDSLSVVARAEAWRVGLARPRPSHPVFVGFDGAGNLLGFGFCGPRRETPPTHDGEFHAVNVLQRGQGLGLGRALMAAMAGALLANGHRSAALWVLRDNLRARQFYQRLGGRVIGEAVHALGGVRLAEVAYGWDQLGPMQRR